MLKLVDEPVAAVIAFNKDETNYPEDSTILVINLGGGTCDVAVLIIN